MSPATPGSVHKNEKASGSEGRAFLIGFYAATASFRLPAALADANHRGNLRRAPTVVLCSVPIGGGVSALGLPAVISGGLISPNKRELVGTPDVSFTLGHGAPCHHLWSNK